MAETRRHADEDQYMHERLRGSVKKKTENHAIYMWGTTTQTQSVKKSDTTDTNRERKKSELYGLTSSLHDLHAARPRDERIQQKKRRRWPAARPSFGRRPAPAASIKCAIAPTLFSGHFTQFRLESNAEDTEGYIRGKPGGRRRREQMKKTLWRAAAHHHEFEASLS